MYEKTFRRGLAAMKNGQSRIAAVEGVSKQAIDRSLKTIRLWAKETLGKDKIGMEDVIAYHMHLIETGQNENAVVSALKEIRGIITEAEKAKRPIEQIGTERDQLKRLIEMATDRLKKLDESDEAPVIEIVGRDESEPKEYPTGDKE